MRQRGPALAVFAEGRGTQELPKFLTTAELAQILRRPESTLRYWRRNGTGPVGIRTGGTYLYPEKNVHEWLHSLDTNEALA